MCAFVGVVVVLQRQEWLRGKMNEILLAAEQIRDELDGGFSRRHLEVRRSNGSGWDGEKEREKKNYTHVVLLACPLPPSTEVAAPPAPHVLRRDDVLKNRELARGRG